MKLGLTVAVPFALVAVVGVVVLSLSCASETKLAAAGGECFLASDCEPGLVCVLQDDGARVCSNDLTQVTGQPPMPADMDAAAADAPTDAPASETGMPDAAEPDTGPPIQDSGDAG